MRFITSVCFALVATSVPAMAQNANSCFHYSGVLDYMKYVKGGATHSRALEISLSDTWNDSDEYTDEINAYFLRLGLPVSRR